MQTPINICQYGGQAVTDWFDGCAGVVRCARECTNAVAVQSLSFEIGVFSLATNVTSHLTDG